MKTTNESVFFLEKNLYSYDEMARMSFEPAKNTLKSAS